LKYLICFRVAPLEFAENLVIPRIFEEKIKFKDCSNFHVSTLIKQHVLLIQFGSKAGFPTYEI